MKKPLIGIVLDHEPAGGYAPYPWYALRENYFNAVINAGGVPLALPYAPDHVERYLSLIQGLIIPGGAFDIDPALYGATQDPASHVIKNHRTQFEIALLNKALDQDIPYLGICAGMQLLNVARGGTLYQNISTDIENALVHDQTNPKDQTSHAIDIVEGTTLAKINPHPAPQVNSTHHQSVHVLGKELIVSAFAPDGVIEAIEDPDHPCCLGIEWHPEYETTPLDRAIFQYFVEKATQA